MNRENSLIVPFWASLFTTLEKCATLKTAWSFNEKAFHNILRENQLLDGG